jgi:hypothetical protein
MTKEQKRTIRRLEKELNRTSGAYSNIGWGRIGVVFYGRSFDSTIGYSISKAGVAKLNSGNVLQVN